MGPDAIKFRPPPPPPYITGPQSTTTPSTDPAPPPPPRTVSKTVDALPGSVLTLVCVCVYVHLCTCMRMCLRCPSLYCTHLSQLYRGVNPVAPKRKKRGSTNDVDPLQCSSPISKLPPIPQHPERPQCPVPNHNNMLVLSGSQVGYEVVVAQFDCDPDHPDELGFMEGDKLVVVKRLNQDWWVSAPF